MPSDKVLKLAGEIKALPVSLQEFFRFILSDPDIMEKTYEIVASEDGFRAGIKCLDCKMTSWAAGDVMNKYCGNCHEFHEQKAREKMYPHLFKKTK